MTPTAKIFAQIILDTQKFHEDVEEERRLFYVGMTRAKNSQNNLL